MHINDCITPCLLADRTLLLRNISAMQEKAHRHGLRLRPHIKTHKCFALARLQMEQGAVGITTSRPDEALRFISHGFSSVTVAYPLLSSTLVNSLFETARQHHAHVSCIADSREGVELLDTLSRQRTIRIPVFLKIDVGLHRCGLRKDDAELPVLARLIADSPSLDFAGLLSHAGHAYAASGPDAIRAIAREELEILCHVRANLERQGYEVPQVSAGATPTILAANTFDGLTEIRPGNYVFLDGTQVRLGLCTPDEVALSVLATIISRNNDYYIIDAGSKTLSSDTGAHGVALHQDYGSAWSPDTFTLQGEELPVVRLSEEHGFIQRGDTNLPVGSKVRIIPNHACPVVNLASRLVLTDNDTVTDIWHVDARNRH